MSEIIQRGRELVAAQVPFAHQGRDFNGIDCIGTVIYMFGFEFEIPAYGRDPVNGELDLALTAKFGSPLLLTPVSLADLRQHDLVSMQYKGPTRHLGVVADHVNLPGQVSLIHTDSMVERATEHIIDEKWRRRIAKVWRIL